MSESNFNESCTTDLLVAFEAGDPKARKILPSRLRNDLLRMAAQIGSDLTPDQRRDVVQQTWRNVLKGDSQYDPTKSSPLTYLRLHMQNAVRQIRASYARAGEPKRASTQSDEDIHAISVEEAPISCKGVDAKQEQLVDAKIILEVAQRIFDDRTSAALRCLSRGNTRKQAADAAGYSRRTLSRRISDLCNYF